MKKTLREKLEQRIKTLENRIEQLQNNIKQYKKFDNCRDAFINQIKLKQFQIVVEQLKEDLK